MRASPKIIRGFKKSQEFFEGWHCFNVVIGGLNKKNIKLLFGPFDFDEAVLHLQETNWGSLLKVLEIFPSATQARKNGWDKDIPMGWSEVRFKKQRTVVFVLRQPFSKWERFKSWLSFQVHQLHRTATRTTKDTAKPTNVG